MAEGMPHRTSRALMAELLLDQMTKSAVLKSKVDKYKKKYHHQNFTGDASLNGLLKDGKWK